MLGIDHVFQGHRLSVLNIGGFALGHAHIEFIIDFFGAFLGTQTAGNAFVHVNIAGFLTDGDGKVAFLSTDINDFRKGK